MRQISEVISKRPQGSRAPTSPVGSLDALAFNTSKSYLRRPSEDNASEERHERLGKANASHDGSRSRHPDSRSRRREQNGQLCRTRTQQSPHCRSDKYRVSARNSGRKPCQRTGAGGDPKRGPASVDSGAPTSRLFATRAVRCESRRGDPEEEIPRYRRKISGAGTRENSPGGGDDSSRRGRGRGEGPRQEDSFPEGLSRPGGFGRS